eukprot:gb/GECG01016002.1/.p1 GENE.gb/GECG01016002.1/~~gb/GECG01016002.1/.p1  ORF type:complete len:119 (+),score=7.83 gb/GECG01016002.1/:1-357(+)
MILYKRVPPMPLRDGIEGARSLRLMEELQGLTESNVQRSAPDIRRKHVHNSQLWLSSYRVPDTILLISVYGVWYAGIIRPIALDHVSSESGQQRRQPLSTAPSFAKRPKTNSSLWVGP